MADTETGELFVLAGTEAPEFFAVVTTVTPDPEAVFVTVIGRVTLEGGKGLLVDVLPAVFAELSVAEEDSDPIGILLATTLLVAGEAEVASVAVLLDICEIRLWDTRVSVADLPLPLGLVHESDEVPVAELSPVGEAVPPVADVSWNNEVPTAEVASVETELSIWIVLPVAELIGDPEVTHVIILLSLVEVYCETEVILVLDPGTTMEAVPTIDAVPRVDVYTVFDELVV
jgi:hypothetical protein